MGYDKIWESNWNIILRALPPGLHCLHVIIWIVGVKSKSLLIIYVQYNMDEM